MDISKIDEKLKVDRKIDDTELIWRCIDGAPFRVYGVYKDEGGYRRIPRDVAEATSEVVTELATNTAGGRIRFITDSERIAIRVTMPSIPHFSHMAYTGVHGLDLYADGIFTKMFVPPN